MVVLLKTFGGIKFPLKNGKQVVLVGNSFFNQIDDSLWSQCKKEHQNIDTMIKDGFIIESKSKDTELQEDSKEDAINNQKKQQTSKRRKEVEIKEVKE